MDGARARRPQKPLVQFTHAVAEADAHKIELEQLAAKDPEFYEYLRKHDQELLDFDAEAEPEDDDEDGDAQMLGSDDEDAEAPRAPVLTKEILRKWQKSLLEVSRHGLFLGRAY